MKLNQLILVVGILSLALTAGCDESGSKAEESAKGAVTEPSDDSAAKKRKKRIKKDRGQAAAKIGERDWEGERASAKVVSGKLRIDISRMDMNDGKVSREQFIMILPDYKGPGTYTTSGGSMFVGVGFDTGEVKAATTDDKVGEVATKAMTGAKTIMLMKTTVVVETADDKQIVGTFSQPAIARYPEISNGSFRAIVKD